MKKNCFLLYVVFVFSCAQNQSQNDFYGTWVSANNGSKMEYEITSAIFTPVWTPRNPTIIAPIEKDTFEIFFWEKITNENMDTKNDYPTGYLLGLRHGLLGNTVARLFIHRDKNSLVSLYEHKGNIQQEIYIKQSLFNSSSQINSSDDNSTNRNITFSEVNVNPSIYHNTLINWTGMAINVVETNSNTTFDFLVGYDMHNTLEGIVPVIFNRNIIFDYEHPFELVGFISVNNDYSFYIEGSRIKQ